MSLVQLKEIKLPDFGVPDQIPAIKDSVYHTRLEQLRTRMTQTGLDALIVYADREHTANFTFLTGFDPRFEEAILILVKGRDPLLVTGPENLG
ncbi:MAG: hypothetical protein EBT35_05930, partial [Alphaproteobacteria bacterium]|nr:hypothetical protein [Alphaproteobacteria bacterium]